MGNQLKKDFTAWSFLSLNFAGFIVFSLLPVIAALVLSFFQWDLVKPANFVGLENYFNLAKDKLFQKSLSVTFYYILLSIPGGIIASLALALALNQKIKGVKFYRAAYFIPVITSMVAVSMVWRWLYNSHFGLINFLLNKIGLPSVNWLSDPVFALPAVALMGIWKGMGYNMVIFLAGLQGIPPHLYEAAKIDGANAWQRFRKITLPLLSPSMLFVTVMSIIWSFQSFDQIYTMTKGRPENATLVSIYYLYQNAYLFFKMGYASAMAWVLFAIILVVTIIQFKILNKRVHYE